VTWYIIGAAGALGWLIFAGWLYGWWHRRG
jgi:hypothetical protein